MFVQCRALFMRETDRLPVDAELDFSQVDYRGTQPFATPVRVIGEITNRAGVVELDAEAVFEYSGACDRCLTPFVRSHTVPVRHVLVTSLENEDSDFVLLDEYRLDLDDLVLADILLELPSKDLCKEDCRGLCPYCGKNLNEGLCGCKTDREDPRLAVLKQLLN